MQTNPKSLLDGVPLKMLRSESGAGETGLKNLQKLREAHGKVLERAIQIAGYSKKEAADQLGGVGPNQLAAWLAATENPQTWRFEQHPRLGPALLQASAEARVGDPRVRVRSVIDIDMEQIA